MGKVNKVSEGEFLYSVREDGERICNDCRYRKDCSERYRVEKLYEQGVIAKIHGCSMYEEHLKETDKRFFGDLR